MRRLAWGTMAVMVALNPAAGLSRQRPDFSGSWVATPGTPGDPAAAPGPVFGARLWLKQEGDRITVTRPVRDTAVSATYPIDGSEVRTRIPGALCMGDGQSIETVSWDGAGLVFTVVGSVPAGGTRLTQSVRRVLRLPRTDALVVEGSVRDSASGAMRQVATVYKRTADPVPAPADTGPKAPATIAQVAWISGVWAGAAGPATVEERWTPAAGGAMLATARTLRGSSMSEFEFLCIAERDGSLVYSAMPNGRSPATHFALTAITDDSATFENPAHDFPKMIRYTRRPDGSLETAIGGDPKSKPQTVGLKRVGNGNR